MNAPKFMIILSDWDIRSTVLGVLRARLSLSGSGANPIREVSGWKNRFKSAASEVCP